MRLRWRERRRVPREAGRPQPCRLRGIAASRDHASAEAELFDAEGLFAVLHNTKEDMSIVDRVIGAVAHPESDEKRNKDA